MKKKYLLGAYALLLILSVCLMFLWKDHLLVGIDEPFVIGMTTLSVRVIGLYVIIAETELLWCALYYYSPPEKKCEFKTDMYIRSGCAAFLVLIGNIPHFFNWSTFSYYMFGLIQPVCCLFLLIHRLWYLVRLARRKKHAV